MIADDFYKTDDEAIDWPTEKPEYADDIKMRRGKVFLDEHQMFSPDVRAQVLSRVIPYRVEYLYDRMAFEVHGYSELFDVVYPNIRSPKYSLIMSEDGVRFLKVTKDPLAHATKFED